MYSDSVLLESRSARSGMAHRVEVLDRVKALAFSTGSTQATTRDVANYFEAALNTVEKLVSRHRAELESNGLRVLRGAELPEYETAKFSVSSDTEGSYPQRRSGLTVFNRRAVLNMAMLLRDSDIARRVRAYLLDVEGNAQPHRTDQPGPCPDEGLKGTVRTLALGYGSLERHVTGLESNGAELGAVLQELGPVIGRISERLEHMNGRLAETERRAGNTEKAVCAMSRRLADLGEEMREMRGDLRGVMRVTGAEPDTHRPRS